MSEREDRKGLFMWREPKSEFWATERAGLPSFAGGVRFRFLSFDSLDKRISLCIEIDDDSTIEGVVQAWHEVLRWRELLQRYNGPWLGGGKSALFYHLDLRHRHGGRSYPKLARWLNDKIATHMQGYARYLALPAFPRDSTWLERLRLLDQLEKEHGADHLAARRADDILAALRPSLSGDERVEILEGGLAEIKAGRPPFLPDFPIAAADVRERVREWRKKWSEFEQWEFDLVGSQVDEEEG